MNGGNCGRTYSGGTTTPLNQQPQHPAGGNGYILTGRGYRHFGPCGSRSFSTSKHSHGHCRPTPSEHQPTNSTSTMPTTKGFAPHPHNSYQANPGGFINGIKNIVNGFINPKLNSDFYWDQHSRHYNPKYRNNYMMDQRQQNSGPAKAATMTAQCNANLKTVFFGSRSTPTASGNVPPTMPSRSAAGEIEIAIFTSDDFPALPAIKKQCFIPASTTPASSNTATKSVPMRCQQQPVRQPPVKRPNFAANASAAAAHDKDIARDFVVLDNPMPKICNPVAATTNACRSAAIGLSAIRCRPRIRQISECSDDSFVICFSDDAPEGVLEVALDSDSDDDSDFDVDSGDSDEDDDDIDETDNHVRNSSETSQPDSGFDDGKDKKVRFNLNPQIHIMYKWDFAYRAARKGHWENFARDRQRFKNRIDILSKIISPIFDTHHREKIYRIRFCDSENNANSD